LLKIYLY